MSLTEVSSAAERAQAIRDQIPAAGLFAEKEWRVSPEPFKIDAALLTEFEQLGPKLLAFYRASNKLCRTGPEWVREWLNLGKPENLLRVARHERFQDELPAVLRPDILLAEDGWKITELDSVPGGIGLTAWLQKIYGRPETMATEFARTILSKGPTAIVVSEEAAVYRPEMEWLIQRIQELQPGIGATVVSPDDLEYRPDGVYAHGKRISLIYRFFELFDLPNLKSSEALLEAAVSGLVQITPPPKPALEEKMFLAFLHSPTLESFWHQELGEQTFSALQRVVPKTWVVEGQEYDWSALKTASQKKRRMVLKLSGFSPLAWGGRSVRIGHDLSAGAWAAAVDHALESFPTAPYILQPFEKARKVPMEYFDFEKQELIRTEGRVRLCPFYFASHCAQNNRDDAKFAGTLATIVPPDKKIIHGMRDAVMTLAISPSAP